MPRDEGRPGRDTIRYARPETLLGSRKQARLVRFDDAMSAEDDYFRFANRNR
jgi:hypothetical protein